MATSRANIVPSAGATLRQMGTTLNNKANLEFKRDELKFKREQLEQTRINDARAAKTSAVNATSSMLTSLQHFTSDPSFPIELRRRAMEVSHQLFTGEAISFSDDDVDPIGVKGEQLFEAGRAMGFGNPQVKQGLDQFRAQYGGSPRGDTVLKDFKQASQDATLHAAGMTDAAIVAMRLGNRGPDDIDRLMLLQMQRSTLDVQGIVNPAINRGIAGLEQKLGISSTALSPADRDESTRITNAAKKQHTRLRRATESKESVDVFLNDPSIDAFNAAQSELNLIDTDPEVQLLERTAAASEAARGPLQRGSAPAIKRQLESRKNDKREAALRQFNRTLKAQLPALRQTHTVETLAMLNDIRKRRDDLNRRGEDTGFLDLQEQSVNAVRDALFEMIEMVENPLFSTEVSSVNRRAAGGGGNATSTRQDSEERLNNLNKALTTLRTNREGFVQAGNIAQGNIRDLRAQREILFQRGRVEAIGTKDQSIVDKNIALAGKADAEVRKINDELNEPDKPVIKVVPFTDEDGNAGKVAIRDDPTNPNGVSILKLDGQPAFAESKPLINFGSPGERKELKDAEIILEELDFIEERFDPSLVGPIDSFFNTATQEALGTLTPEQNDFISAVRNINVQRINELYGAALSEREAVLASKAIPNLNMRDDELKAAFRTTRRNVRRAQKILRENTGKAPRGGTVESSFNAIQQANPNLTKEQIFQRMVEEGIE